MACPVPSPPWAIAALFGDGLGTSRARSLFARVAVARALVLEPPVLLADEPTGNLDPATGADVAGLLLEINRTRGTALIVVTHSARMAEDLGRTLVLVDGQLEEGNAMAEGLA